MTTIKLKRSDVPGKVPLPGDLELGELAANTADGNLFLKKNNGSVETVWGASQADAKYLAKSSNLADVPNKNTARTNLGVYSQTEVEGLITASESQADTKYLAKSSNLADVPNKTTARNNLSVYSQAQVNSAISTAINNAPMLGVGQIWQNLTGSRSINTTYTNNTGKPIMVMVAGNIDNYTVSIGSATLSGTDGSGYSNISFIVPNSTTYRVNGTATVLQGWMELR